MISRVVPATAVVALAMASTPLSADVPVSLRGSLEAMERQHLVALDFGAPFVRTPAELDRLVAEGALVRLEGNEDYGFRSGVRVLEARPEMRTFIEYLAADYRAACNEQLIVTSLTRPTSRQPSNAHRLSVHPAGIAVDLRVSQRAECRQWLEATLLEMEGEGLLDVTRERYPPHYHVALFPARYMDFIAPIIEAERERERERAARAEEARLAAQPLYGMVAASPAAEDGGVDWTYLAALPILALAGLGLRIKRWRQQG